MKCKLTDIEGLIFTYIFVAMIGMFNFSFIKQLFILLSYFILAVILILKGDR